VWRTRVGYAGGSTESPTYRNIGDHTECFGVDFDPTEISYDDLLQLFWSSHDPTHPSYSRQYTSLILAHDGEQLRLAEMSRDRLESALRRPVLTRIEPFQRFFLAEDYHQKYRLRSTPHLMREFESMYPDSAAFACSTAAARVNGYLDGGGSRTRLDGEIDELGISTDASKYLRSRCQ
jgi:peptide-methionine (S)-S-oxide reductase